MATKERGISTPPVKPCATRKRIIRSRECVCPQQMEKSTNKIEFTIRYLFRENAAESHPVSGITTISATRWDVGIHEISSAFLDDHTRRVKGNPLYLGIDKHRGIGCIPTLGPFRSHC